MLRDWLFDVYRQTWIIKILLKNPWMADTRILFVMINLAQSLQWESSWSVSGKIAFHSSLLNLSWLLPLPLPALHATLDLIGLGVLAWWYTWRMPHFFTTDSLIITYVSFPPEWDVATKSQTLSASAGYFSQLFCDSKTEILKASGVDTQLHFILSLLFGCQLVEGCIVTLAFNVTVPRRFFNESVLWWGIRILASMSFTAFTAFAVCNYQLLATVICQKCFNHPSFKQQETT